MSGLSGCQGQRFEAYLRLFVHRRHQGSCDSISGQIPCVVEVTGTFSEVTCCQFAVSVDLTPAAWLVLCCLLTSTIIGVALQDESLPDATPSTSGVSEVVRLSPDVAPIFSLVADSHALGDSHNQVFCGNLAKSVVAWEPPDSQLIPKVHLNSHTGWVRGLATSRRWLFR